MATDDVRARAEAARAAARKLGDVLYEKQMAYGDVASMQLGLWQVLLAPYDDGAGHYRIPHALMADVPRLTRALDRVGRIVGNPGRDPMGEDPWLDLAGDAVIGTIVPRVAGEGKKPCVEPECELPEHDGPHRRVHAGGLQVWHTRESLEAVAQRAFWDNVGRSEPAYTHGFDPRDP